MKKFRSITFATGVLTFAFSWAASAQTLDSSEALHIPRIQTSRGGSLNWSGYAVSDSPVTSVTGTFNVPVVEPPGSVNGFQPDISAWVGIDGYTSGTVEQIGIAGTWDAAANKAVYYAWWEMYPRNSQIIKGLTISAGDSITATVTSLGRGRFQLSITDNTSGQSFTTTASAPVGGADAAQLSSAEWVVERAATIFKGYLTILPLASFADPGVIFTDGSYTVGTGSPIDLQDAVIPGNEYAGYPAPLPSQPFWEKMFITDLNNNALDEVSDVSGNSFSATFGANGAPLPLPGVFRQK